MIDFDKDKDLKHFKEALEINDKQLAKDILKFARKEKERWSMKVLIMDKLMEKN